MRFQRFWWDSRDSDEISKITHIQVIQVTRDSESDLPFTIEFDLLWTLGSVKPSHDFEWVILVLKSLGKFFGRLTFVEVDTEVLVYKKILPALKCFSPKYYFFLFCVLRTDPPVGGTELRWK